jgi:hypothetical protein
MQTRSVPTYLPDDVPLAKDTFRIDRRKRARLRVHWPVLLSGGPGAPLQAVTHDLSSDGFYCAAATPFVPGEVWTCILCVPAYHPDDLTRMIPLHCRVCVVRVEALAQSGMYGVGCRIKDYRVQSSATAGSEPARICEFRSEPNNSDGYFDGHFAS